jgi:6-phosphogluconolactonase
MRVEVLPDAAAVARRAAEIIARLARDRVGEKGRFSMAVSGGAEPWAAFRELAALDVPWKDVHIVQVDERVAPDGDPARNLTHLQESLLDRVPIPKEQVYAMPVTEPDLEAAAARYGQALVRAAGSPPRLDLVHLGLGTDGHTASLVPGDPVLDVRDRDVAVTGEYQGRRRMTLTYPALERAGMILWIVPGERKAEALARLLAADKSVPAGRVSQQQATVLADRSAARDLKPEA